MSNLPLYENHFTGSQVNSITINDEKNKVVIKFHNGHELVLYADVSLFEDKTIRVFLKRYETSPFYLEDKKEFEHE